MKLFGTDGIRGKYCQHPVTSGVAEQLGKAIVTSLSETPKIVIASDTRSSGKDLQAAVVRGIVSAGGKVVVLGILPSNAVSFAVQNEKAQGGIMITASHNPADENGFKFFNSNGFKFSEYEEKEIEKLLDAKNFRTGSGLEEHMPDYSAYRDFLVSSSHTDLKGLRVVADAGNGAASFILEDVFKKLKIHMEIINNKPNGKNINDNCGALYPQKLQEIVKKKSFDAGVAFDGDADRLVMIDEEGNLINGDAIIAIVALDLKKKKRLNKNTVVVTEYSNSGLDVSLDRAGINVVRVKTGDKFVSSVLSDKEYSIGGEASGHIIIPELSKTADAVLASIRILQIMKREGKKLSELAGIIKTYPQVLVNVEVREKQDLRFIKNMRAIREIESKLGDEGRVFLRYSGTEDKMRIFVEGKSETKIKEYANEIVEAVKSAIGK